jgi:hypothetical protein
MPNPLPNEALNKLGKVLGLLGSDHSGEQAAAATTATRLLRSHGWTWADITAVIADLEAAATNAPIANTQPGAGAASDLAEVHSLVAECLQRAWALDQWQRDFVHSMRSWDGPVTPKQLQKLRDLAANVRRASAAHVDETTAKTAL